MARALRIPIPVGGRPYGVPPQEIRNDQLADASNVYIEQGALRDRRGFDVFSTQSHAVNALGAQAIIPSLYDRTPATTVSPCLLVAVTDGVFSTTWTQAANPSAAWSDVTPATNFESASAERASNIGAVQSRFGSRWWNFPLSGDQTTVVTATGTADKPHYWSSNFTNVDDFVELANAPARAIDVISAAARLVLSVLNENGTCDIHVSAVNDMTTWPSGLFAGLNDTPDILVGMSPVSRNSFMIHKDASQWIATSTPNAAFPFRFDSAGTFAGPINSRCIVNTPRAVYWMATDGSIYKAEGASIQNIGESVQQFLITDIHNNFTPLAHGSYLASRNQVWWFYPSVQSFPYVNLVFVRLFGVMVYDIPSNTFWHQTISHPVGDDELEVVSSMGWPARSPMGRTAGLLIGIKTSASGDYVHILRDGAEDASDGVEFFDFPRGDGGGTDPGSQAISAFFQTAVRAYAGPQNKTIIRSYQPMFRKEASASNLITIDFLGGDYPDSLSTLHSVTVDPSDANRPIIDDLSVEANWVSIKHSWTVESDHSRIWDGGILWADNIDDGVR